MSGPSLLDRLKKKFGDKIAGANFDAIDPWIEVVPDALREVAAFLKSDAELQLNFCNCITAVDYFEPDPKKAAKADPRIIEFDVRTDEMLVNMGPQHPSTHGVLRLVLRTDGIL
jgi:hypothetical protein